MKRRARRLLILFANTGGGHRSSAYAVAQAARDRYGEQVQTELVDALAEYAPWPLNRLRHIYPYLVCMRGQPWAVGYRLSDGPWRVALLTRGFWPWVRTALGQLFREHPADVVISCHPLLNHLTQRFVSQTGAETHLITLVTDLATAHTFWFVPQVARCLVPTKEVRRRALASGVPAGRISVTGLPVSPNFVAAAREDTVTVRQRLGLEPGLPVVLLTSGAEGMGSLRRLCREVTSTSLQAQWVIITGRNECLRARLNAEVWPVPVQVKGFVHNMHEWMRAADLLVTKAGPSTISEALVMGLPMVLGGALPGQERPNVDYVVRAGAGMWAPKPDQVAEVVCELLAPGSRRLAHMAARSRTLAQPDAAYRVAEIVWGIAGGELTQ